MKMNDKILAVIDELISISQITSDKTLKIDVNKIKIGISPEEIHDIIVGLSIKHPLFLFAFGIFPKCSILSDIRISTNTNLLKGLKREFLPAIDKKPNINNGIKFLEIVESRNLKRIIIINKDYTKQLKINFNGKNWRYILDLAKNKKIPSTVSGAKAFLDYMNSNKHNPLYSEKNYRPQQIVRKDGDTIVLNIKIDIISDKAHKTRLNKLKKT
ncbi:MAG: hypothetical protein ACD_19C00020G0006 [uncultured bacterium]|nr:MAG: hypothetical protein ACD_19C00020G0006 [uncultured bacterium]